MMPNWAILWKANTVAIERMSTALYCPDGPFLTRLEKAVIGLYLNNFGKYVLRFMITFKILWPYEVTV